ncbi:MAG TPA: prephenate dehydratase [Bacteroidetes bacterium]|nr:prephenate dehydratase [Bacteroidota bacterium]
MDTLIGTTINKGKASSTQVALKIAIQGYPGAFHDIAARQFFKTREVEIVPGDTFDDLVQAIQNKTADLGLMAIENTLAGSIIGNYYRLLENGLEASGEIYLRIKQNLMALPGQKIEGLREVYSHPMAIAQCKKYFQQHPHIRLVEAEDTALSAKHIRDKNLKNTGAIASTLAAEMYGLEILAPSIETNKQNHTRFLVLHREGDTDVPAGADKVSLCFSVSHSVGSLHKVLSVMAAYELNLSKIQSIPIAGKKWEYFFFVDFICDGQVQWRQGIESLRPLVVDLKILGVYRQGEHIEV